MTDFNTPIEVAAPFSFGPVENSITFDETWCHTNKIFKWLRKNVGVKNRDWFSQITDIRGYLQMCISFRIVDPGAEVMFALVHAEDRVTVMLDDKGRLTHLPRK